MYTKYWVTNVFHSQEAGYRIWELGGTLDSSSPIPLFSREKKWGPEKLNDLSRVARL